APADTGSASGPLPAGAYWLQLDAPQLANNSPVRHLMVVGTAGITLKAAPKALVAWATDLDKGQPLGGVDVQFYNETQPLGAPVKTDGNGLARLDLSAPIAVQRDSLFAVINDGKNLGVGSTSWNEGLQAYNFNQPTDYNPTTFTAYLYSDRSIYEPGQPVYFKGVLRTRDDVTYALPNIKSVPVEVSLPGG